MTPTDAAGRLGLSVRQINHWARSGYIELPAHGPGKQREISQDVFERLRHIACLLDAGFTVAAAAELAARVTHTGTYIKSDVLAFALTPQVSVTINKERAA